MLFRKFGGGAKGNWTFLIGQILAVINFCPYFWKCCFSALTYRKTHTTGAPATNSSPLLLKGPMLKWNIIQTCFFVCKRTNLPNLRRSLDCGGNADDNNKSQDPFSSLKSRSRGLYRHSKDDTSTKCNKYECFKLETHYCCFGVWWKKISKCIP